MALFFRLQFSVDIGVSDFDFCQGLFLLRGGAFAEFLAVFLHLFFEVLAGRFPGAGHQRNVTGSLLLAVVGRGRVSAATLSLAVVRSAAGMVPGLGRAISLSGAVILAAGPLILAGVESAAGVRLAFGLGNFTATRVVSLRGRLVLGGSSGTGFGRRGCGLVIAATAGDSSRQYAADRGHR